MSNKDLANVISSAKRYRHGSLFRCDICGKFISYRQIDMGLIKTEFTPDTQVTTEKTTFTHKHCL